MSTSNLARTSDTSSRTADTKAAPPSLTGWLQYSIAGAIHYFAGPDGVCRRFQRELAAHTDHAEATINRQLNAMIEAGAIIVRELGNTNPTNKAIPKGYELHASIRGLFPILNRAAKQRIRRVSSWTLHPRIRKTREAKDWTSSSAQTQRWFLQSIAMLGETTDRDLEELAAMMGFKKKSKAYGSQASLLATDLEYFRRIARHRRFNPETNACERTITELAGESGFVSESTYREKQWPPRSSDTNATKLYQAIFKKAGGLHRPTKLSTRGLARLAYQDVHIEEGMRRAYRVIPVLEKKKVLKVDHAPAGRYDDEGNALTNTYTLVKILTLEGGVPFPERKRFFQELMAKHHISRKKLFRHAQCSHETVRSVIDGISVRDDSLEAVRLGFLALDVMVNPSDIPAA